MTAIPWITAGERVVGDNSPLYADVANRPLRALLTAWGYDPDAVSGRPGVYGPVFNVTAYGAVAGGPDCAAAHNAAVAAAVAAGGGVVYYPAGFWYFLTSPAPLTGTLGVIIQGAGRNVTSLVQGASGVNVVMLGNGATRVQVCDLWIGSFSAHATGYGLFSQGGAIAVSELLVERVTFQNLPTPIFLDGTTGTFRDVRYLQTIAGATVGVVFHMIRCNGGTRVENWSSLATVGSFPSDCFRVDSDCDSIMFDRCEVALGGNGGGAAFRFMNSTGGASTGPRLCRATDCYGENFSTGFLVNDARDIRLTNCHTANNTLASYDIQGGDSITLTNCFAFYNQQHGFAVSGGKGIHFIGCTATNNGQQTANTYDGFFINGADTVRIIGCRAGDFVDAYAASQKYGIVLFTGGHIVTDNDLQNNTSAPYADFSGTTTTYRRGNRYSAGAMQGQTALVNGTVTVNTAEIIASDNVVLTRVVGAGTTRGVLTRGTIVAGTSFVIRAEDLAGALSADDDSTVFWEIVH